jgi:hypothetical protein
MALYSQTIKNIVAGISQQPAILRHPEQLEEQINGMSTEANGLQKRPPTLHLANLQASLVTNIKPMVHLINRDENEQYAAMFNGNSVQVWDLIGASKTVNYQGSASAYLTTSSPRKSLKTVTVADYTFIVNTEKTVAMTSAITADVWAAQGALINVKSGQYGRTYAVILDDVQVAAFSTPDGSVAAHTAQIDTNYIAWQLAASLIGGYTVAQSGEGWLYIVKNSGSITSIKTKDGFNNQAMYGFHKTAQRFSMLPATAPHGYLVQIAGEPGSGADDYYVVYDATNKVWKETARPGILNSFDSSTMPHVLVREANGTFTCKPAEWDKRTVGDDDSNPEPSFINQKVNDLFFFRNRLGFAAGENVIMSKSGEFFKFWMSSAVDILDTDAIDNAASDNKVSILYHALPFNEELLLFSAQSQFIGRAEGIISPKNFRIDSATEYEDSVQVRPIVAGRNVYFPAPRALYTSIKEFYTVQDVTSVKNAQDITSHVASYIPNGVHKLLSSTSENLLLVLTEGAENHIYVYKYLFEEETRKQASWSHWNLGEGVKILGGGFVGPTLYLVVQRGEGTFLEKMVFTWNTKDNNVEPYRVFLDRKVLTAPIPLANYDAVWNKTTVDIQALYGTTPLSEECYAIVSPSGFFKTFKLEDLQSGTIRLDGNFTGQRLTVGTCPPHKVVFSPVMLKTVDERGTRSDTEGTLYVRNFWVNYVDCGYFKVTVEHFNKETYEYEMTARILGSGNNKLGELPFETGKFKFPVQSLSTECKITIESPYPVPFCIIGAGWEGNYHRRSQKV